MMVIPVLSLKAFHERVSGWGIGLGSGISPIIQSH